MLVNLSSGSRSVSPSCLPFINQYNEVRVQTVFEFVFTCIAFREVCIKYEQFCSWLTVYFKSVLFVCLAAEH